ncbi:MAG: sulfatase/phosphatase domain-containing protein [Spirochaetota bacterium]
MRFANTCDIYSTVLELAGIGRATAERDGRSLVPLLGGEAVDDWPQECVTHRLSATALLCSHRMIRWNGYKYVFYASGPDELYDLECDPWERENLVDELEYAEVLAEGRHRLGRWMRTKGDKIFRDCCVVNGVDRASL